MPTPSPASAAPRRPAAAHACRVGCDWTRRDPLGGEHRDTAPAPRQGWSQRADRWIDAGVGAFAVFTLLANAVVLLGGSLRHLMGASAVAFALLIGLQVVGTRRRAHAGAARAAAPEASACVDAARTHPGDESLPWAWQVIAGVAALGAAVQYAWTGSLVRVWLAAVAISAAVGAREALQWGKGETSQTGKGETSQPGALAAAPVRHRDCVVAAPRWLVPALMLLCALTVALAHRADHDDAFYLNIAVAAVDEPSAPLLARDTLHGYDDVPLGLPVFRVLSYELALAAQSALTRVDALVWAHVVWPPLFALLFPLAWARLLRRLAPRDWAWLLVGVVASFFFFADGGATHGEFALLRLQQGKSIFLVVLWPLIAHAGLVFGERATPRHWARLAAAQIASVGLTTNALWLAPVIGGLAVGVGVVSAVADMPTNSPLRTGQRALQRTRTLFFGALASFHAVALALWLRADTLRAFGEAPHPLPSLQQTSLEFMRDAVEMVAGSGWPAALVLFAVMLAGAIAPSPRLRLFMACFTLTACLLFWTPLWARLVATQITGPDTYFRVLWIWPVPVALAVLLTAGQAALARRGITQAAPRVAALAGASALAFALGGATWVPSAANGVRLDSPLAPRIPPDELALARALARYAGPDDFVLAPVGASRWLPLLHGHPHPLVVREMLLDVLDERLGRRELTLRAQLTRMAGGDVRPPHSGALLAGAIDSVPLRVVALTGAARKWQDVGQALKESPLERVETNDDYEIWVRPADAPSDPNLDDA